MIGDVLAHLVNVRNESIDISVFSPPYNRKILYASYQDNLSREDYLSWMKKVVLELKRVIKPNGSIFINVGNCGSDPWLVSDVSNLFRNVFVLQNTIVWVKSISIDGDTVGHFKPINSQRYLNNTHEYILHFTLSGNVEIDRLSIGVPFKDKSNIARRQHTRDKRCAGNTWYIPYDSVQSKNQKFNHPSTFPLELPLRCIQLHGVKHARVLDPFCGVGTSLVAAEILGCSGLGIELDSDYAAEAERRLLDCLSVKGITK